MNTIQIIYINGPSSSGKTTLVYALQNALEKPFLHIGIDNVISMMPAKLNNWEGGHAPLGFSWKQGVDKEGHPIQHIQLGSFARKMSQTLKALVLTLANMNHYIIIDDVAFGKEDVDQWRQLLKNYKTLWVGIHAPLAVLEAREKERGNRILGSARAQYYEVHQGIRYDLEFDTSKMPVEKIVEAIQTRVQAYCD